MTFAEGALRVVLDTNVWISGLIAPAGVPGRLLRAAAEGRILPIMSWALAEELVDVLDRPHLRERMRLDEGDVREFMVLLAPLLPRVDVPVEVRDPDDLPVVSAAVAARVELLVSGDRDLVENDQLRLWLAERDVGVMTPAELLERLMPETRGE